jgi:hypothetical protein
MAFFVSGIFQMLVIDMDISGSLVTSPGFSLSVAVSQLNLTASGTTNSGIIRTVDGSTLIIQPYQYQDSWATQPKFKLTDFNTDTTKWEQHSVRGATDYALHSLGTVGAPVISKYIFPRNTGFFVETWFYTKPKTSAYQLFDMSFGKYFSLFLHSNGTCELYDTRNTATLTGAGQPNAPIATGSISSSQDITGKDVQITILPYRSKYIIISSNLGGYFIANVGGTLDTTSADKPAGGTALSVITEAAGVSFYNSSTPINALFNFSPLMYPGSASLTTPNFPLKYPLTAQPTLEANADKSFGTNCTLSPTVTYNTSLAPQNNFGYSITLTSAAGSTGVGGIGGGNAAIFGNLYTAQDFINYVHCERALGTRQYTTNTILNPISASMTLNADRSQKTFKFTLDNPADEWTALKDMQNRKLRAYYDLPSNHGGTSEDDLNDPDYALLTDNGGPYTIFVGFSDIPDFIDGSASRVTVNAVSMRKKLAHFLLSSSKSWDGASHCQVITDLLKLAGYVSEDDVDGFVITEADVEIVIPIWDDTPLPSADSGTEPLYRPADGMSALDFIENEVLTYTGWILDDIGGVWYYATRDWFISNSIGGYGVPFISATSLMNEQGVSEQTTPNADISYVAMLADPAPRQIMLNETIANDITVIGSDSEGNPIVSHYSDEASVSDKTALNYLGDRFYYILISASIADQATANTVCAILANNITQAKRNIEFTLPDLRPELYLWAAIDADGYGTCLVQSIDVDLSMDRCRKTRYVAELVAA